MKHYWVICILAVCCAIDCNGYRDVFYPPPTITASVRDGGVINSGFLTGTAVGTFGIPSVSVALDSVIFSPAQLVSDSGGNVAIWKVALPVGGSTWRDYSKHKITIQADDYASSTMTLSVRKGINKDINGDGYPDIAVGAPSVNSDLGNVYVYLSRGASGISSATDTSATTILTGTASSGRFGVSVELADVNGDGYADVIAGADGANTSFGKAYVFHSSGTGGIMGANDTSASSILTGTAQGQFGNPIGVGDINGDGFSDIVVGAATLNTQVGKVYVFHSAGSAGMTSANDASASAILTGTAALGLFGGEIVIGDVNGDGYADVVIGAFGTSTNLGKAYIFQSSGTGGIMSGNDSAATTTLIGTLTNGLFGHNMAVGDINGDGYADIAVGAYNTNTNLGSVFIFQSRGQSGVASANDIAAKTILTGSGSSCCFGIDVSIGDVNGDGFADLAVAAHGGGAAIGRTYVYYSTGSFGITNTNDTSAPTTITSTISGSFFGQAIGLTDVNGDGYADLAIGAYAANTNLGSMYIFSSSGSTGVTSQDDRTASVTLTGTLTAGKFGKSVSQ